MGRPKDNSLGSSFGWRKPVPVSLGRTPAGHLRWMARAGDPVSPGLAELESAFAADWREALFALAADRVDTHGAPAAHFCQQVAGRTGASIFSEENLPRDLDVTRANPQTEG